MIEVRVFAKNCDVNWLILKKIDYIFKNMKKCMQYEVNPFRVCGHEKDFPS